ncbi:response regulator [Sphaerotilus sp.]|uniref:response regulator n=1 Tax=Sphaerotilus sp. TaxID=2093942 RepID=UPI0025DF8BBB|nr:response regulator [Sphaerotilus sp.]
MANILVVDDEMGIRALLQEILTDEGHSVELAENAAQARALRERQRPDLVLLDIWMPDVDGITLLKEWGAGAQLNMPVIMMSGHGTIDTAVEATKYGAMAFLEKPITLQKLLRAVEQGLSKPAPRSAAPPGHTGTGAGDAAHAGLARIERTDYLPAAEAAHYAGPGHVYNPGSGASSNALTTLTITMASGPQAEQIFLLDRPLREARDAFEKAYFEFHLARENGSMTRVAERTGLERTHLYRKLKQLGVDLTRSKRGAG